MPLPVYADELHKTGANFLNMPFFCYHIMSPHNLRILIVRRHTFCIEFIGVIITFDFRRVPETLQVRASFYRLVWRPRLVRRRLYRKH